MNNLTKEQVEKVFQRIDDYLIGDLERMISLPEKTKGDLGFTCIQTILSGIELLGILKNGSKKESAFKSFWMKNLGKHNAIYKSNKLSHLIRNAVRNGTAHYFMVKNGITVDRLKGKHLGIKRNRDSGEISIHINCKEFFNDFKAAYNLFKEECISEDVNISNGLNILFKDSSEGQQYVNDYIDEIGVKPDMFIYADDPITSASLPFDRSILKQLIPYSDRPTGVSTSMPATLEPIDINDILAKTDL